MNILTLLSGWQTKAIAFLAAAISILGAMYKYKSSKLDKVEHELKTVSKKAEIAKIQSEQKETALENESETIEEQMQNVKESRHDDVNSL